MPLVPPWVPEVAPDDGTEGDAVDQTWPVVPTPVPPQQPVPIAPRGRFGPSRTSLGEYAHSGSPDDLRRGLSHYVGKGLGGAATAARRFSGTAHTAGALYGALSLAAAGQPAAPGNLFDPAQLAGHTATEIMDAAVEAVRPTDGTQDAEANRLAIRDALSELLTRFPDADLLNLSEEQRLFAIERFVAFDIYTRFYLDVGQAIKDKAHNATSALARLKEVRSYIKEAVSATFRQLRFAGQALSARHITQLVSQALRETFQVFEEYVR